MTGVPPATQSAFRSLTEIKASQAEKLMDGPTFVASLARENEMGANFLSRLARDEKSQSLARGARSRTLELAEELQTLAYRKKKIHHAPGC